MAETPSVLKMLQLFDMYMADFYNALHTGVVSILHKKSKRVDNILQEVCFFSCLINVKKDLFLNI